MKTSHVVAAALLAIFSTATQGVPCQAVETPPSRDLQIYFLDMMGGASTLIVTPLGESVLIDTGSREPKHRDAERIYAAAEHAGLKQIDCLVTTHFHLDHIGGILQLTKLIPVRKFIDKGHPVPESEVNTGWFKQLYPLYQEATGGKAEVLQAGDDIPLKNDPQGKIPPLKLHCVAAEKKVEGFDGDIDAPVSGYMMKKPDDSDNARSIALVLSYGKFQLFAGGDITWNVEHHLAVPKNVVGEVDVYQVTHHGLDQSNNPVLLAALKPTVCIAMNGPRKGIEPNAFRAMKQLPSVKAIYQIHYNAQYGEQGNAPLEYIANGKDPRKGTFIRVAVGPKGDVFTVSIGTDGPQRTYAVK
jgi:competence protein ComEC